MECREFESRIPAYVNGEMDMEEMQAFCARMDQMRQYLEQQDRPALEAMFRQSTQARRAFDQKEKER